MGYTYRFPSITEKDLPNGVTVLGITQQALGTIEITIQMPIGKYADPEGKEGVLELLVATMQKGHAGMNPEEFADSLENRGAGLFADVGNEHLVFGCRCLSRFADEIFPLFWKTVHDPALDGGEFSRLKKELLTSLQAETADPGSISDRHFYAELYGKNHPAGRLHSTRSISRISIDDIRTFYGEHFGAGGCTVLFAGEFDLHKMEESWLPALTQWAGKARPVKEIPSELRPGTTSVRLVKKPSLSQVTLVLGHTVPGELAEQREELALANYILGGGNFSSRLMSRVRTSTGNTYGIHSSISTDRQIGTFRIGTSTQNAQVSEVMKAIFDVLQELANDGLTSEELERAKKFAIGNLAFQLEGLDNVVEKILWLRHYDRPLSYIEQFGERIEAISLNSVNAAIQKHLASKNFAITAVGNAADVAPVFEKYGSVKIVDVRQDN